MITTSYLPCVTSHLPKIIFHVSFVTCNMSCVWCLMNIKIFKIYISDKVVDLFSGGFVINRATPSKYSPVYKLPLCVSVCLLVPPSFKYIRCGYLTFYLTYVSNAKYNKMFFNSILVMTLNTIYEWKANFMIISPILMEQKGNRFLYYVQNLLHQDKHKYFKHAVI